MTGGQELWYTLPIPYNVGNDGRGWHFVLICKFIELRHNSTGKRLFGVNLNGLQVLTGIDLVEEVGFATVHDEEIEFRLDTENWLLWVTSVGKLRVRMDQPAAFSLTGELHVGITPQQGNARLCGLQVIQGTLEELHEERYRQLNKGKRKKGKRKGKRRALDDDEEEEEEQAQGFVTKNARSIGAALLVLIVGTVTQLDLLPDYDTHQLRNKPRLGAERAPDTPPRQTKRLSTAEKKAKAAEKSALLAAQRELEATKAAEKSAALAQKSPAKRVETAEEKARRLEREQRKQQKQDKARMESMRAEAQALHAAREVRRKAQKKSADAFAALQEIQQKEEEDARHALQLLREAEEKQREAEAEELRRVKAEEKRQAMAKAQLKKQREEALTYKAKQMQRMQQRKQLQQQRAQQLQQEQQQQQQQQQLMKQKSLQGRQRSKQQHSVNGSQGDTARGRGQQQHAQEQQYQQNQPQQPSPNAWSQRAPAVARGPAGSSSAASGDDSVAATPRWEAHDSNWFSSPGTSPDGSGTLTTARPFNLVGNDEMDGMDEMASGTRVDLDFLSDSVEQLDGDSYLGGMRRVGSSSSLGSGGSTDLDSASSLTTWLAEHDFPELWGTLMKMGISTLRDLAAIQLNEAFLVNSVGIRTMPSRIRFRADVRALQDQQQDQLTGGSGRGAVPSAGVPADWSAAQAQASDKQAVLNTDWFWETQPAAPQQDAAAGPTGGFGSSFLGNLW
jgi:hypothetical protein